MAYTSIYIRRERVETCRRKIAEWQEKLAKAEEELRRAEEVGDPPECMDVVCRSHAKFRVGGTEECCTLHLSAAIQSVRDATGNANVETWPWERQQNVDNELSKE